jgi:protein-S-isoprenylcysteine O-methyltransferase Ste14
LLTIGFTVALTFASVELPYWLTRLADRWIDIPDYHPAIEPESIEAFLQSARPIGYICLVAVLVLIVVGFVLGRRTPSTLGAVLLFLPTFGYFAGYMFFLAGLGALRALWLPAWEDLLHLGDVAYVPYMAIVWPLWQAGVDARMAVAYAAIAAGLMIFVIATLIWFTSRTRNQDLADSWLYRYSRHPQYLGWILWTYGIMLLAAQAPVPMGGSNPGASLPWIISTLVVVCVALNEESHMRRRLGSEYETYRTATPFLFPLPGAIRRVMRAPLRWVTRTRYPDSGRQLVAVFLVYLLLTMALSVPFVAARWPSGLGWSDWPHTRIEAPAPAPDVPVDLPVNDE